MALHIHSIHSIHSTTNPPASTTKPTPPNPSRITVNGIVKMAATGVGHSWDYEKEGMHENAKKVDVCQVVWGGWVVD